ncbi:TlpA family protein disulfide reductase [Mucilaginibacter mali]|uniref:TlpA family protein disulfide reductase n=1 Tax=Mucilaginibacter mali TaxID=2740462 RepID=A0A7D4TM75_9SPHI|nr:TlpA disulfide reductase family protein [Mucilaginibacter mali]QKJ29813.1 TlpA family protein disulfide reductase [Mucilaginibacter mali]
MKPYKLIAILLCTAFASNAQKLNIPKGKTFEITTRNKDVGTFKRDDIYTYSFKSLGRNGEGNNVLECKIARVIIYDNRSGKVQLNTDSIRNTNLYSTEALTALALLNKPFTVTINPKGEVVGTAGMQETLQQALTQWNINADVAKNILKQMPEQISKRIDDLFFKPAQAQQAKPVLGNADMANQFRITNINANTLRAYASSATDNSKVTHEYIVDKETGLVKSSTKTEDARLTPNAEMGIRANSVSKITLTQAMTQASAHPLPDTAWINMAAKLSYWSAAFKKGTSSDSAKVYQFIKNPDSRFANDKYYLTRRLDLVQSVRSDRSYLTYDSLLLETPNKFLEGNQVHLHNKLHTALSKQGAQAAYELTKYAYKTNAFDEWVQYSFSQYFRDNKDSKTDDVSQKRNYDLLALFKTNPDPVYVRKIQPLYMWAMARKQKNNIPLMLQTAEDFEKMGDKDMQVGNGGRYALLLYQMLVAAKQTEAAQKLMDVTVQKLERYTADTANADRYVHQNLLAGAYYMQYLNRDTVADPQAMQLLAKAAKYSPNSRAERAYGSNYDRFFLGTKDSYRDILISKLLDAGNEAEALAMFAQHINAAPENIKEMQDLYVKKFPGRDFKQFFKEGIMSKWAMAPAFTLKGIDGKEHALTEYKDRWLMLDFWGTWCGPCREEMPKVNKFNDEVVAGKYQNVSFLSIACNDTENNVKMYLDETKFGMPVAMSDGEVQSNYKVPGYPCKIIISPEGRMIAVDFGKDWLSVIKNFSQL